MKLYDAMNEQMNFEYESAYIYKTMAAFLKDMEMDGMAHFMELQASEEVEHAEEFKNMLQNLGNSVKFRTLDPGAGKFDSILDVFEKALAHEKVVTENITKLYEQALKEKNRPVQNFLSKFIHEQVEEEATFNSIITKIERVKDSWAGLYKLDGLLGQRQ